MKSVKLVVLVALLLVVSFSQGIKPSHRRIAKKRDGFHQIVGYKLQQLQEDTQFGRALTVAKQSWTDIANEQLGELIKVEQKVQRIETEPRFTYRLTFTSLNAQYPQVSIILVKKDDAYTYKQSIPSAKDASKINGTRLSRKYFMLPKQMDDIGRITRSKTYNDIYGK